MAPVRVKRLPADVYVGAVVFVFAAVVFVASLQIPRVGSNVEIIGPKVVPIALSVVLAIGAVALVLDGLRVTAARSRQSLPEGAAAGQHADDMVADGEQDEDEDDEPAVLPGQGRRFVVLAAMLLAYLLVFIPVGYLLATFAFLTAVSMYIERRKWVRNLVFAATFSAVVYVAFTYGLQVELPPGLIGLPA